MKRYLFVFITLLILSGIIGVQKMNSSKIYLAEKTQLQEKLQKEIIKSIKTFDGEVSVYIKDLKGDIEFCYNDEKLFPSASLVKLLIMASVFKAANDGVLNLNDEMTLLPKHKISGSGKLKNMRTGKKFTIEKLVYYMITESDNTATNMLTDRLGFTYINWVIKQLGLKNTNFDRLIMDLKARDYYHIENYTTARDIGIFLTELYYGKIINKEASDKMIEILCQQKINDRIPRFLSKDYTIAHKTGYMKTLCHDAGIVFSSKGDFIICVLTSDFRNIKVAKKFIGNLAYKTVEIL